MTDTALIIGEALVDAVVPPDGDRSEHPGGSPANVALGLARLGRDAALLTWLADDPHGDLVRAHLTDSGVRVLAGDGGPERTPVATAHLDADGSASYDFDLTWDLPAVDVGQPVVVHTGSIGAVLEPGGAKVAELLAAHRDTATITYDPNLRPALMRPAVETLPLVEHLIGLADVVKVSDEDLAWLHPGVPTEEIARDWASRGPALVVVTLGGSGALAVTAGGEELAVTAPQVQVADTVGAGDSFMSGLIDGLWSAGLIGAGRRTALRAITLDAVQDVLVRCVRIAAITVSRSGANPPTAAELGS
ncbi:carbohydrate kinase [Cellulomonas sp. NPDC089187]|uniref:carbohydrate kinase family protein n=1 Tax=Cellulomonas sp. NPDC089187 TaxID=3154970 RepID=UPI00344A91A8